MRSIFLTSLGIVFAIGALDVLSAPRNVQPAAPSTAYVDPPRDLDAALEEYWWCSREQPDHCEWRTR